MYIHLADSDKFIV